MTSNQTTAAHFPASLLPTLRSLIARANEYAAGSEEFSFATEDEISTSALVRDGLHRAGFDLELDTAYQVWSFVSANYQAGWLDGPHDTDGALGAVQDLCQHVADGTDYAGFSGRG